MAYQIINPASAVPYSYDWAGDLDSGVTIADATWSSDPAGLTFASESESGQIASVVISVPVNKKIYKIFCAITDSNGLVQKKAVLTLRGAAE